MLAVIAVVAAVLVVVGVSVVLIATDDADPAAPEASGGTGAARNPGAASFRGLKVSSGQELEKYLLRGIEAPNGMSVVPGSLKSAGTLAGASRSILAAPATCRTGGYFDDKSSAPTAEVSFTSSDGQVVIGQYIMVLPIGLGPRVMSYLRASAERCQEFEASDEQGVVTHYSTSWQRTSLGDEGILFRARLTAKSSWSTRTGDSQSFYVRFGDTLLLVSGLATGRALVPADGVEATVEKAIEKMRRAG